jgi:predicted Fe-Mo cluster-binding NifX family protein
MLVCLACYGDRVAALLENATELRFYGAGAAGSPDQRPVVRVRLPAPVLEGGLGALLAALESAGAGALVCGGVTGCALEALARAGLTVVPWVGGVADEVAQAWAAGRIATMKLPGCAGCGRRRRGRRPPGLPKERRIMQNDTIAVTSEGPALGDRVDPRFGRAAGFVIVNLATGQSSYVDNGGSQVMSQGAGIQAAENVARAGAGVVLSGFVGPKAFQALAAAGIRVVQNVENMTVAQAVERYRKGEFAVAEAPNGGPGARGGSGH